MANDFSKRNVFQYFRFTKSLSIKSRSNVFCLESETKFQVILDCILRNFGIFKQYLKNYRPEEKPPSIIFVALSPDCNFHIKAFYNKTGTSKVEAISKAEKAQFLKYEILVFEPPPPP